MNLKRGWLSKGKPRRIAPASLFIALTLLGSLLPGFTEDTQVTEAAEADVLPATETALPIGLKPDAAAKAAPLPRSRKPLLRRTMPIRIPPSRITKRPSPSIPATRNWP